MSQKEFQPVKVIENAAGGWLSVREAANTFLREQYVAEFNRLFQAAPGQRGHAFLPCRNRDLERIFSLQFERAAQRDNTVSFQNLSSQIERVSWRATLAGCQGVRRYWVLSTGC